jgi:starch synthase
MAWNQEGSYFWMKVLSVSSEVAPFAKTGGLADVCSSLPEALSRSGVEVSVALPLYRSVLAGDFELEDVLEDVPVELGNQKLSADIFRGQLIDNVDAFFIKRDEFYDRSYLYAMPRGEYFDNANRFIFFCKAIFSFSKALNIKWDIIHCHDWQTAIIPIFLKTLYTDEPLFKDIKSLLTIHNFGYQGIFPAAIFPLTGLPPYLLSIDGLEFWGKVNLLKGGIIFADRITTVSPTYAREVQTKRFGFGLDGVLGDYAHKFSGILNGADYQEWNPETDPYIKSRYSKENLSGKIKCKEDILKEFNLSFECMKRPLIGMVARLAAQKGIDLLESAIDEIMANGVGLIILGEGERRYEEILNRISSRYRETMAVKIAFDNRLAHKIEAGSDIFLMPSRYEPCGLNQIYSLRYGTLPVVYHTGGLADTVIEAQEETGGGTGFKFYDYSTTGLSEAIDKAIKCFEKKEFWKKLVIQAMSCDFSWSRAAGEYLNIYRKLLSQ